MRVKEKLYIVVAGTIGTLHLQEHSHRVLNIATEGSQPLSTEGAINSSMVAAERDGHELDCLEGLFLWQQKQDRSVDIDEN